MTRPALTLAAALLTSGAMLVGPTAGDEPVQGLQPFAFDDCLSVPEIVGHLGQHLVERGHGGVVGGVRVPGSRPRWRARRAQPRARRVGGSLGEDGEEIERSRTWLYNHSCGHP